MNKKISLFFVSFFLFFLLLSGETIERIIIEGNKRVSRDTVLFYMRSKEGGTYSAAILRKDFKSLWDTGFFENIKIEFDEGINGKIIRVGLKENLLFSSVRYNVGKKIKRSDIIDRLRENNISLIPSSYYTPARVKRAEKIIYDLLSEKGFIDGKVTIVTRENSGQIDLTVRVIPGHRMRVGTVDFPGLDTKLVSPSFLKKGVTNNKPHGFLSWIGKKDIFNREKIDEDLEGIRLRLQQKGFLEAKVGKPVLKMYRKAHVFGKIQKMLRISIPVELGPRYRVGDIRIQGNKVVKGEILRRFITIKKGYFYNMKKRNRIIEDLKNFYGAKGYLYSQIIPREDLDSERNVANLTIKINEGDVVHVGKIEFEGNTFTKDHVLRREWFLKEGGRLSTKAFEMSVRRMNQQGFVSIEKVPEMKPDPYDPHKMDIKCEVKEMSRQMLNFNFGYSGYRGLFGTVGYSTRNFFGMGETFMLNLTHGTKIKNYRFSFTEPYLFNLPANMGIDLHKTSYDYPEFTRQGEGFDVVTSFRFLKFFGASLAYGFERIEVSDFNEVFKITYPDLVEGRRTISAISPTLYYSTLNSPFFPTSGTKYLFNYRYSGGFLGGDIELHKFKFEFAKFIQISRRQTFGFHAVYQFMKEFGKNPVPVYERYFLGGERSMRGYDPYTIVPRDKNGEILGGSKAFFLNFEYSLALNDNLSVVLFYDAGNAYASGRPIDFRDVYSSIGLEFRINVPMIGIPIRLIFAYNFRKIFESDRKFDFRFGFGPSF